MKKEKLVKFAKKIADSQAKNLVSVYVYGTLLREEALIVLKDANVSFLNKLPKNPDVKVSIFTQNELKRSLDVFPMEFLEMQDDRELLEGVDCLKDVSVNSDNLRHECEFYLRSNLIKLRESVLSTKSNPSDLIKHSIPSFLSIFKMILKLENKPVSQSPKEVAKDLAAVFPFDTEVFDQVIDYPDKKIGDKLASYLTQIETILKHVDQAKV